MPDRRAVDPFDPKTPFSEPSSLAEPLAEPTAAPDVRGVPIDDFPRRRRLTPLLLFFGALALVGYFVFTAMDGVVNTNVLDARVSTLQGEIDEFEWQAEQLEALVAFLDSDEYIERVAREELGLVRVGEEAFAIQAPLRPGISILRSPWWANLLPQPALPADLPSASPPPSAAEKPATDGSAAETPPASLAPTP